MLSSLDDYPHVKNQDITWFFLSRDIDDQTPFQLDWIRGTTGHTQPKELFADATFAWWLSLCKKPDCCISSRDINDRRILKPDRTDGTTGHTQPKKLVSDATFLWW